MMDWDRLRATKFADESPTDWPPHVRAISINGLGLFGINTRTGRLHWDGAEISIKRSVELRPFEQTLAFVATVATFGSFILLLGKAMKWWP